MSRTSDIDVPEPFAHIDVGVDDPAVMMFEKFLRILVVSGASPKAISASESSPLAPLLILTVSL